MNKVLSQALRKAVSDFAPQSTEYSKDKRPDLFSLNDDTELFKMNTDPTVQIADNLKNLILTNFGERLGRYSIGCNFTTLTMMVGFNVKASPNATTGRQYIAQAVKPQ